MKTLLIIDANLGQARAYMAKTLLGAAARKAKLEIIDNPNDAEMAIVLGDFIPNDSALNGKNVWLGANVTVLGGVTIGDNAVVAAGAVVTNDIPPNTLAAGVPARVIRAL